MDNWFEINWNTDTFLYEQKYGSYMLKVHFAAVACFVILGAVMEFGCKYINR